MPEWTGIMQVLEYHVVPDQRLAIANFVNGQTLPTLLPGHMLKVSRLGFNTSLAEQQRRSVIMAAAAPMTIMPTPCLMLDAITSLGDIQQEHGRVLPKCGCR